MTQTAVNISINGKELKVSCPSGQESALIAAAKALDERLSSALDKSNGSNVEQALLMTALNLSNDLLQAKKDFQQEKAATADKIALLQSTIEHALSDQTNKRA